MIAENELKQLAQSCELVTPSSDLLSVTSGQPESEKDLMLSLAEHLDHDGAAMSFSAAGAYDFYQSVALQCSGEKAALDWYQVQGDALKTYLDIKKGVESCLAGLFAMKQAAVIDADPETVVSDLLTQLSSLQHVGREGGRIVVLPSSMPARFRHALCTRLKYLSLEIIVIDCDKTTGCLTVAQLDSLGADVLAIVFSYPNYFGVIEDVALISDWAHAHKIKTIVVADALALTHIKSPAQLCEQIDFIVADLQPLGLPLSRKGNAPTMLAGSKIPHEILQTESFTLFDDLLKIQGFLGGQSAQQLQQPYTQARSSLKILRKGLTAIENISLRFTGYCLNECVIQIDQIDVKRALQILAGHNILAGYPLVEDYPELDGCLLIHCTDQHTIAEIERFIQKMATVVKNLSTAGCPVKPKFT